jgi:hypothetical protein
MSCGPEPRLLFKEGSGTTMCTTAPDPTTWLEGGTLMLLHVQQLRTLPSCRKGFVTATRPAVPYGPWATSTKKSLPGLSIQLGPRVSKARMHVSKTPDVKAIMGSQDVWVDGAFSACKTCRQAATI